MANAKHSTDGIRHSAVSSRKRAPRNRRRLWWIAVPVVLLVAAVAWVGVRGYLAKGELERAQALISEIKTQALAFDLASVGASADELADCTGSAVSLTSDPIWRAFEGLPSIGVNLSAVRQIAASTDFVITDVVGPLLAVASELDPAELAPKDGAINLAPFEAAIPAVAEAERNTLTAIKQFESINVDGAVGQVSAARDQVLGLLGQVSPALTTANSVLPLIPPLMGSEEIRTYAVMFQNNAEARALGGTALSFAVLKLDRGKISLAEVVPAGFENFQQYSSSVIPIPDGASEVYPDGAFGTFIANATIRPSFVTAGEMTQAFWELDRGYSLDGVFSVDPVALSYILRATAPINLSTGYELTADTLVPFLLNGVYQLYNTGDSSEDNRLQDVVYAEAVDTTFSQLLSGALDPVALVPAILQGWGERRLSFWSAHENEQAELALLKMEHGLPRSDDTTDRIGVYFQDNVGSKLNYYLQQTVHVANAVCRADGLQNYRITIDLVNSIQPADVPFISGSITGQWEREGLEPAAQRMIVMLYAPPGSQIVGAYVDGNAVALQPLHDTDYPVGLTKVILPPGGGSSITFDLILPSPAGKKIEAEVTPLVNPTAVDYTALDCATVPVG